MNLQDQQNRQIIYILVGAMVLIACMVTFLRSNVWVLWGVK